MDEKIITLTDGTKLEVKVNFMTLYLIQKHGLDKVINKEALSEDENMEAAAKLIYIIPVSYTHLTLPTICSV